MDYRITRIGVVSLGTLVGVVSGLLTLVFSWPLIFVDLIGGMGLGTLSFLFFVVTAFVGGFVSGAIAALIANLLFGITGGLHVELEQV